MILLYNKNVFTKLECENVFMIKFLSFFLLDKLIFILNFLEYSSYFYKW